VVETNAVRRADINASRVLLEMLRVYVDKGAVRVGDYGKSAPGGLLFRLFELTGILFGDYPYAYKELFA
jgi:hypothetical protein